MLGSLSFPISASVHDDSGKFRHYRKDTKNGLPQVTFSGALVESGGEFVRDSQECAITSGPFYRLPAVFARTKTTTKDKPIYKIEIVRAL